MKTTFKFTIIIIILNLFLFFNVHAQELKIAKRVQIRNAAQNYAVTFIGGSVSDYCMAIAFDDKGNVYVTGYTFSADFPTTAGSYNTTHKGKVDVFVIKFDKVLKTIIASTLISGAANDCAYSILYDEGGFLYIAGYTDSKDFPTTASAYNTNYSGGEGDAFILKMDSDLKTVIASTFLGGSGLEDDSKSQTIVQDNDGNIYIAGITGSDDFPTTHGAFREKFNGGSKDVFVSKFDSELKRMLASTLIGGSNEDRLVHSLCIDSKNDEICIGGWTDSFDFPVSKDAYSSEVSGHYNGFVSKLTMDLTEMTASTILNGGWMYSMMIHKDGDIYVGGHADNTLPTTSKAYYKTFDKHYDQGFISRFSNDLSKLKSSTLLPGTMPARLGGAINCLSFAQSPEGDIISTGLVGPEDFPSTPGSFDETPNGETDVFILKMDKDLSRLLASTFMGGSKFDNIRMATDKRGNCYIAGFTRSSDFPTTNGSAFKKFNGGGWDGYIIRIDDNLSAEVFEGFHDAAKRNNLKKVRQLLSQNGELLEKVDKYKRTALHSAARYGAVSVSEYLIEKGANLNDGDESGNMPLHLASMYCQDEVVELLINSNVDINAVNDDGDTPLSLAAIYGTPKTIGLLLTRKADGSIRDKEGNTILHNAAFYGKVKTAQEIMKYKPEVDSKNKAGKTPLHIAVGSNNNEHLTERLLDQGANPAVADSTGKSALHLASDSNIKVLLKRGVNANSQDRDGNTRLHSLLNITLKNKTVFPWMKEMIKIFMEEGADPNIKNKIGKSPMDLAIESGVQEAIDLLKAKK